jgi:hypothetical protein
VIKKALTIRSRSKVERKRRVSESMRKRERAKK